ncbi:MAG: hypothetical protein K2Q09_00900 [Phycisphaerales bacterium]|nr:hypothetical protein [Phycisphaerales bacterium]
MSKGKEIAKFLCGSMTFDAVLHGYLWLSGTPLKVLGVTLTPALNATMTLLSAGVAGALGVYGWRARTARSLGIDAARPLP